MSKINCLKLFIAVAALLILFGCSPITKLQDKGAVKQQTFHHSMEFSTLKSVIVLPVEINGASKNFLFDTGADFSLIQRDTIISKTQKYGGASKRKMKLGNEIIKNITIGNVTFINTYALNGDLVGLKEQIPNFGGIIGQSIITKANWLIDYRNKRLVVSSNDLSDNTFQKIAIKRSDGAPYMFITIDGKNYKVIIDTGSSASFSIPKDSKLAGKMLSTYNFTNNEREIYSLGGLQTVKEKVGIIPLIKLGNIEFSDVEADVRNSSQLRIGMRFFEKYVIYIDNLNRDYKIKKPDD